MPYAIIITRGTVDFQGHHLVRGYAGTAPDDPLKVPVVLESDWPTFQRLCDEQLCFYDALRVTEQFQGSEVWVLARPIPIPPREA